MKVCVCSRLCVCFCLFTFLKGDPVIPYSADFSHWNGDAGNWACWSADLQHAESLSFQSVLCSRDCWKTLVLQLYWKMKRFDQYDQWNRFWMHKLITLLILDIPKFCEFGFSNLRSSNQGHCVSLFRTEASLQFFWQTAEPSDSLQGFQLH